MSGGLRPFWHHMMPLEVTKGVQGTMVCAIFGLLAAGPSILVGILAT